MDNKGFTMVEMLSVMVIIGIIGTVIFIKIGDEREKVRVTGMKETAQSALPLAQECYFRNGSVSPPIADQKICKAVNQVWPELEDENCEYYGEEPKEFGIECPAYERKVVCKVGGNAKCEIEVMN